MASPLWSAVAKTDIGTIRKINEDSFLESTKYSLWCVADGMGGHTCGDIASALIVKTLKDLTNNVTREVTIKNIVHCLTAVNEQLWQLSFTKNSVVGSTIALLLFENKVAHCIWAGDSRIYRLRDNKIQRLTKDHSQVEDMIDAGLLTEIEAENHPNANIITRAIGAAEFTELECRTYNLLSDDIFLICSDGLNKVLTDAEIEFALNNTVKAPFSTMADFLISFSLSRNATDNVTCITVFPRKYDSLENDQSDITLPFKNIKHPLIKKYP